MMSKTTCPECQGAMVAGTLVDSTRDSVQRAQWVEGEVVPRFWATTPRPKNEHVFAVTAYRCRSCGFLKLFADQVVS
jgi:hypothetical protein